MQRLSGFAGRTPCGFRNREAEYAQALLGDLITVARPAVFGIVRRGKRSAREGRGDRAVARPAVFGIVRRAINEAYGREVFGVARPAVFGIVRRDYGGLIEDIAAGRTPCGFRNREADYPTV